MLTDISALWFRVLDDSVLLIKHPPQPRTSAQVRGCFIPKNSGFLNII